MYPHSILSITLHSLSGTALRGLLLNWLNSASQHTVVTPNPEILLLAQSDKNFATILNRADLSLPDGIGLKFAAWFNGFNLCRHTGVDTLQLLSEICAQTDRTLLLLGGEKKNSERAAQNLYQKFSGLKIFTIDPGKVSDTGEIDLQTLEQILKISPAVVAVALGQGKQEKFADRYLKQLQSVKIIIGIGGALDMIGGKLPRAPKILRILGLEWFWRLTIEPSRWPRMVRAVLVFPTTVIFERLFTKKQK